MGEETKGAKKIRCLFFFFCCEIVSVFFQSKESSYRPHFPLAFVLLGHRQSLSQQQEMVSLTASQTKWRHEGLLGAVRFENTLLFLLARKRIFLDLMIEAWPNVLLISPLLIWEPSYCACLKTSLHKENRHWIHLRVWHISQAPACWNFVLKTLKWRCI